MDNLSSTNSGKQAPSQWQREEGRKLRHCMSCCTLEQMLGMWPIVTLHKQHCSLTAVTARMHILAVTRSANLVGTPRFAAVCVAAVNHRYQPRRSQAHTATAGNHPSLTKLAARCKLWLLQTAAVGAWLLRCLSLTPAITPLGMCPCRLSMS